MDCDCDEDDRDLDGHETKRLPPNMLRSRIMDHMVNCKPKEGIGVIEGALSFDEFSEENDQAMEDLDERKLHFGRGVLGSCRAALKTCLKRVIPVRRAKN